jgi:hemoglobin/transferrin/lactoferrin receptor protein
VFGDVAWLDGELETLEIAGAAPVEDSLTRRQPTTVHVGTRYEPPGTGYFGEAFVTWADDADDLSLSDMADTSRIPPGGTPGYTVLDLRGGAEIAKGWDLYFGVENVTDEDYRIHGSGSNRVGRNVYVGFSWSF